MRPASYSAEYSRPASSAAAPQAAWGVRDIRPNLLNVAAALTILIIVAVILKELRVVLEPLFVAVFLYYLAHPVVTFLTRRGVSNGLAHVIVFAAFAVLLVSLAGVLIERVDELGRQLPVFQERLRQAGASTANDVAGDLPFFRRHLRLMLGRFDLIGPVEGAVSGFMGGLVTFGSGMLLAIFYFIFLVQEQHSLPARLASVYGRERAARIGEVGDRINRSIARYMYVKCLAGLITSAVALAAMLALKLDLALLWAAALFILNFIPYVGSLVGFTFPIAVAILQFDGPGPVLILAGIFLATDMFVGNYWEPRVAGHRLNLSPLVVVFALAFWGWIWGTVGMILAVPITVSLRYVLENIPYTRSLAVLISNRPAERSQP